MLGSTATRCARARWPAPREAVRLIDMFDHHGGHPRMGAADVIPFMPVEASTMDECVELARDFGRELAETLGVPVYLYDRAALSPGASVARRGPQGRVRGPARRGRARRAAARLRTARDRASRGDGGGGPQAARGVQRLPRRHRRGRGEGDRARRARVVGRPARAPRDRRSRVPERGGIVTVSMNLVDHEVTGLRDAFDAVAARGGRARHADRRTSEIVGLVPASALAPGDVEYLRLAGFEPDAADPGAAGGRRGRRSER